MEFRVQGVGVRGLLFTFSGVMFRVQGLEFRVRVSVWGAGLRVGV